MTAPQTRFVDQFTGRLAGRPSKFFTALAEADSFCAEVAATERLRRDNALLRSQAEGLAEAYERLVEDNTELLHRIQELEAERDAAITERDHFRAMAHQWMAQRSAGTAL